jgi:hypothetical protein
MNRQQFLNIIENPVSDKEQNLSVVKELIESFPYYAAPYVVLSKIFYDDNSIYFDKYLKLSAAYVGDRELLYEYINRKYEETAIPTLEPAEQNVEVTPVEEKIQESKPLTLEVPDEVEQAPIESNIPVETVKEEAAIEERERETEGVKESERDPEPTEAREAGPVTENIEPVVEAPVAEAIPETPVQEISKEETETSAKAGEKTEAKPAKNRRSFNSASADPLGLETLASFDYFAYQERLNRQAAEEIKPDVRNEPKVAKNKETREENTANQAYSFTEWMQRLKQKPAVNTQALPIEVKAEKAPAPVAKKQLDDIIDTFIRTEPRIKPKPAKIFNPENMAQQSAEEDFSLATETLANIYLRQGLDEKAIEIFRQLILKFPEKNSYFAGKIEAIKNKED